MPLPLAAGIFTILVISMGIMYFELSKRKETTNRLEKLLKDSRRELASLEILESRFLNRIGDVLAIPLKTIESSSTCLSIAEGGIPDNIRSDLHELSEEVKSLIRILSVFKDISTANDESAMGKDSVNQVDIVQMDDIVSTAAMEISEEATDKQVSLSVTICGSVKVAGKEAQLAEAVSSILREALKSADPATLMTVELRIETNMELKVGWNCAEQQLSEEPHLLGAGFVRLVASAHGGWLNVEMEHRQITLILPVAGDNQ